MDEIKAIISTDGKTRLIGIIGWPVGHSLSPLMHNSAFHFLGLNYNYIPLAVRPEFLPKAVASLKTFGFVGANVTIPYKTEIMQYLDKLDESAAETGAVNTIHCINGECIGYNTDSEGFIQSLLTAAVPVAGKCAAILGAGGAAKAIVAGLRKHGITRVLIGARDLGKAESLASIATKSSNLVEYYAYDWQAAKFGSAITGCDIIINATPLGMWPKYGECPPLAWNKVKEGTVLCDVVYNPVCTEFLKTGAANGCKTVDGLGMLLEQGRLAFKIWTSQKMPKNGIKNLLSAAINNINENYGKCEYKKSNF